jgi:hypothetical protein
MNYAPGKVCVPASACQQQVCLRSSSVKVLFIRAPFREVEHEAVEGTFPDRDLAGLHVHKVQGVSDADTAAATLVAIRRKNAPADLSN